MGEQKPEKMKKHLCVGLLAHVDAGKTTLSESILYLQGNIRSQGRVDHGNAFLDNFDLERKRGITIFSKQARISLGEYELTLLDTPGHVDFSAEMERTLQVLDYAILVISGADGVQGHVETLWKLLKIYQIPVFLFINKMDQEGTDRAALMEELKKRLNENCVDFGALQAQEEETIETIAMCEEELLENYLDTGKLDQSRIPKLIFERKLFPCYFGSALKNEGVQELLDGLQNFFLPKEYPEVFQARVFKITRDEQGARLTHMKITGGSLKVKSLLDNQQEEGKEHWEEKADQIRIYSGMGFQAVKEVNAGEICAVTGLNHTYSGEGLGEEPQAALPVLEPVLTYQIRLPEGEDVHGMFLKLQKLEEEVPELHLVWNERLGEIHAQVMGEVQIEVLQSLIRERFHVETTFGSGSIVYKETIQDPVEGVGHFEPLRHYAEVHLLLEPGERGSEMQFECHISEDVLDRNWQRLILTHLEEKKHVGVLTGSEITDMKISLLSGRAHLKHTEGGDFRQSTYRAVRQGLRKAKSILLEPVYAFRLEVPTENVGRALADIQRMQGSFSPPEMEGDFSILTGSAPVSEMNGYQVEVNAYTKGRGRLFLELKGYEPCHNEEAVIAAKNYDPEQDLENPTGSVFCAHGAGFVVSWDEVENYMHLESGFSESPKQEELYIREKEKGTTAPGFYDDKELQEIFERTYGSVKRERGAFDQVRRQKQEPVKVKRISRQEPLEEYLLVDGYNVIFAWDELKELSKISMEGARGKLMDILSNYQGYKKMTLILVFDAYKVEGNPGEVLKYHNIHVVYTKEAETADQYIEKVVHEIGRKYQVTVATSDALEQVIILGQGAKRLSAKGLREEIELANREIRGDYLNQPTGGKNYLFGNLTEELSEFMENIRLGKKTMESYGEK